MFYSAVESKTGQFWHTFRAVTLLMEDTPTGYKLSLFEDLSRFVGDDSIKHAVNLDLGDGEVIRCSGLVLANTSPHLEVCF